MKRLLVLLLFPGLLLTGCTTDEAVYTQRSDPDEPVVIALEDDGDYSVPILDSMTGAIGTISYTHYEIHEGYSFTVIDTNDLPNMMTREILIVAPDTASWAHLVWEIEHELETSIQFYVDTTYSDNGTEINSFNRNGNSANTATTLVYHSPTVTDNGTLVGVIQQGADKKAGGSDRENNEFILKQDTTYLIRINNLTVNDNLVFMRLNWYEHAE